MPGQALSTSEKIAAAALDILEREGAAAVTTRRVARAVGITPMAIYHHFPNRERLLQFVTELEFAKLADKLTIVSHLSSDGDRLLHSMDYYLDYALRHPRVFDYVFSYKRPDARRFPVDFLSRRSPTINIVAGMIEDAIRSGILEHDDSWEVAIQLWALAHGYAALHRAGRFSLSQSQFRELFHRAMARLFDGLRRRVTRRKRGLHQ
jgi:AcrR family transcriptional regulator